MRLAAIADLHGHLPVVPACDVLVIGGDVTPAHDHAVDHQAAWLDTTFRTWLEAAPAQHIVGIAGNHDFVFERAPEAVPADLPWTYLQDTAAEVAGLTFWGSPWTPWFFDWAFNAPKGDDEERFLRDLYASVPDAIDVFLTHGPPAGFGDHTSAGMDVGSRAALDVVRSHRPRLALFGHIHEGRGRWTDGPTTLANVAAVDLRYELVDEPFMLFDL